MNSFTTVGYIHVKDGRVLLVKPKKHDVFYVPGGKLEEGESEIEALIREVQEELDVDLIPDSIRSYDRFTDQAYAKPKGVTVDIIAYFGEHTGNPKPKNEIEDTRYFSYDEYLAMSNVAPAVKLIFDDLKNKGIIL